MGPLGIQNLPSQKTNINNTNLRGSGFPSLVRDAIPRPRGRAGRAGDAKRYAPRPAHSLPLTRAGAPRAGGSAARSHPAHCAPRPAVAAADRRRPSGCPPPAPHGAARRATAAASTLAPAPTRALTAAGGPRRRSALPNAIAGGRWRLGTDALAHSGRPGVGVAGREGAWPTCRVTHTGPSGQWGRPGYNGGQAAGARKARGNRCLTSADRINSRAAERGNPAAKSQEREREREPLAANGGRKAPARGEAAPPPRPWARGLSGLGQGLLFRSLARVGSGTGFGQPVLWPLVHGQLTPCPPRHPI
ncbi:hypothetical protein GHT09_012518 [Marmota monax]|uniref:Uncharacterized protein n=1 Tax=Marmota monax TaxID=9995 RepID=A0A834UKT1_MARMO|nr:hypothetical protein GHT09_012518 [Marmota monax]